MQNMVAASRDILFSITVFSCSIFGTFDIIKLSGKNIWEICALNQIP